MTATTRTAPPAVYLTQADYDRLSELVGDTPEGADGPVLLGAELSRAVIAPADGKRLFVRLGSWVEYEDLVTGRARRVCVVTPDEANVDQGRISVLSPVGAALIGMLPGKTYRWTADNGREHALKVTAVEPAA